MSKAEKPYTISGPSIRPLIIARKSGRCSVYPYSELSSRGIPLYKRMIKKALAHFESALESDPKSGLAYYWKGRALEYQGALTQFLLLLVFRMLYL